MWVNLGHISFFHFFNFFKGNNWPFHHYACMRINVKWTVMARTLMLPQAKLQPAEMLVIHLDRFPAHLDLTGAAEVGQNLWINYIAMLHDHWEETCLSVISFTSRCIMPLAFFKTRPTLIIDKVILIKHLSWNKCADKTNFSHKV